MTSQIFSDILRFLEQVPGATAVTALNIALASVSAVAAVASARAARASISRPRPIIEITTRSNEPWAGWTTIRVTIRNPSRSTMHIDRVSTGLLQRAHVDMVQRLRRERLTTERSYVTRERRDVSRMELPDAAPSIPKVSAISNLAIRINAESPNPSRVDIACAPDADGICRLPRKLVFHYKWLDQRQRKMTHKAII